MGAGEVAAKVVFFLFFLLIQISLIYNKFFRQYKLLKSKTVAATCREGTFSSLYVPFVETNKLENCPL